jgi:RNA polymerase sigma factor (sigma-70 family)
MADLKKYSEEELVNLLRQKSQSAFNYLYDNYSAAIYTNILNIVKDEQVAADVLQETFVKIWRQLDSYDEKKSRLFTWMMAISRNTAIDMLRSKDFRNQQQNLELDESVYKATSEMKMEDMGLRKVINALKPEHKNIVDLAYFGGYTHSEIAKLLDIPAGTVKTRLRAGLLQLKILLGERGY